MGPLNSSLKPGPVRRNRGDGIFSLGPVTMKWQGALAGDPTPRQRARWVSPCAPAQRCAGSSPADVTEWGRPSPEAAPLRGIESDARLPLCVRTATSVAALRNRRKTPRPAPVVPLHQPRPPHHDGPHHIAQVPVRGAGRAPMVERHVRTLARAGRPHRCRKDLVPGTRSRRQPRRGGSRRLRPGGRSCGESGDPRSATAAGLQRCLLVRLPHGTGPARRPDPSLGVVDRSY